MSEGVGVIAAVAKKAWGWWVLAGLSSAALVVHGSLYYPRLPDIVPTHFGLDGQVTDTGSKDTLFAIYVATGLGTALLLAAVAAGTPLCEPGVPNRSYWVGTQARRLETQRQLSSLILQLLSLTNLLLMWMFDEVFRFGIACAEPRDLTNPTCKAEQQRQMWWPWVGMSLYIVLCIWLPVRLMHHFSKTPPPEEGEEAFLFAPSDQDRCWEDSNNWKCGLFYVCASDPRVLVPKRFGIGWTFNLGVVGGQAACGVLTVVIALSTVASLVCAAGHCLEGE
mmetsp:Transcript_10267/g.24121  ORF Transcript_10267/g.24121 Transcript_10267/m.24121 type:complete len:279 (-) Transcript_10267:772-1608(-)